MKEKRILLADADSQALEEFRQALGEGWEIVCAKSGPLALAEMEKHQSSVVVADLDLPEVDGAELLNRLRKKNPRSIRFLAAKESDKERVMKSARGAHQFLTKPYDRNAIKEAVERAMATEVWVASDKLRDLISRVRTLPTIPTIYLEVVAALRSPSATTEQVGAIIAKDMAMMTKLLQVLNSACFGLNRQITEPAEAVGILGFETVKSMVMTIKLLNQYDKLKPEYFSIDKLWSHSTDVGRTARQLVLAETGDRAMAEMAFTAGLMHDLGKVVLAANFEDQYHGALLVGYKQGLPAWEVERDVFGASHGEVGAYLLGLWGLPLEVLEAAALHHVPSRSANRGFTPLTAVHVANVLEREVNPDELGMAPPKLDEAYLADMDLLGRVDAWREAVSSREFTKMDKSRIAQTGSPKTAFASRKPVPKTNFPPTNEPRRESAGFAGQRKWVYGGSIASAGFLFLAATALLLRVQTIQNEPPPAPRTEEQPTAPRPTQPEPVVPPTNSPQIVTTPDLAVDPMVARARSSATNSTATPPVEDQKLWDFKLQGITFAAGNSSAIINGQSVRPNDRISGARVVEITPSSVTLEFQGERKTLTLKPQ